MQNYKIKRMSKRMINNWLSAIDEMLDHYKGRKKIGVRSYCPICIVSDCGDCIWEIIEETDCVDFLGEIYASLDLEVEEARDDFRYKKWHKARLAQLPRWTKILKAELKRRGNEKMAKGKMATRKAPVAKAKKEKNQMVPSVISGNDKFPGS